MKRAAITVIYNQACEQSLTCRNLLAHAPRDLQVIVFDNSTREFGNRAFCDAHGWVYLGGGGNLGLSKAYNACIAHLRSTDPEGYFCLLDDDTEVTGEYFDKLHAAMEAGSLLAVPLVYADGRLLSPCRITPCHKATLFPDEDALAAYGGPITAINSGMAMHLRLFESYRYDEHIFLDGIDHTHLLKLAALGIHPTVLQVRFDHHFSGDEKPPMEGALTRFGIFARDYAYIFKDAKSRYLYLVGKRALKLTLQYKAFAFLKVFFRELP